MVLVALIMNIKGNIKISVLKFLMVRFVWLHNQFISRINYDKSTL